MKFGEIWDKFELYIMSLWFLFFLIIVITVDIPLCFGENCQYIGFWEVIKKNIVPVISLLLVLFGVIFYYHFDYRISGSKKLPVEITEIEDLNYEHLTFLTTYIIPLIRKDSRGGSQKGSWKRLVKELHINSISNNINMTKYYNN